MNRSYYYDYEGADVGFLPSDAPQGGPVRDRDMHNQFVIVGASVAVLTLVTLAAQMAMLLIFSFATPDFALTPLFQFLLSTVPLYGVGLPVMWIILKRAKPARPAKQKFGAGHWMILYIIATGCMLLGSLVGNGAMSAIDGLLGLESSNALDSILGDAPLWQTFLFTAVVAPIGEEFIFRKLLVDRMRTYGELPAILVSGLLFGLFHGNLYQFFYAAMLGVLLAYIYVRSGKIWLSMLMHGAINLVGGVLTSWITSEIDLEAMETLSTDALLSYIGEHAVAYGALMVYELWMFGCLIAGLILVLTRRKKAQLSAPAVSLSPKSVWRHGVFTWGMILAYVLCGLEILLSIF